MVKLSDDPAVFPALANPTRRSILERLQSGPRGISDLAEPFDMSLVAVSKHVHALEDAGLVRIHREGRRRVCHLDPRPLLPALRWLAGIASFWTDELDQIERYLEATGESASRDDDDG